MPAALRWTWSPTLTSPQGEHRPPPKLTTLTNTASHAYVLQTAGCGTPVTQPAVRVQRYIESFFADWYRIYLPDPEENIFNLEWIPPDAALHCRQTQIGDTRPACHHTPMHRRIPQTAGTTGHCQEITSTCSQPIPAGPPAQASTQTQTGSSSSRGSSSAATATCSQSRRAPAPGRRQSR